MMPMMRRRQGSSIGARRAERLLESAAPLGPREQRVAAVLTALAARDGSAAADEADAVGRSDGAVPTEVLAEVPAEVPAEVLAAFAQQAARDGRTRGGARTRRAGTRGAACPDRRPGSWAWRAARAAAVKAVVVVLAVSSGTVVAAAADILPAPAQRAAHSLFGSWGVPAPDRQGGAGTPSPSAPSSATATDPASSNPATSAAGPGGTPATTRADTTSASDAAVTPTPDPSATNNARRPTATGKPSKTPTTARTATPGRERTASAENDNAG
jgi:hypothetical protein